MEMLPCRFQIDTGEENGGSHGQWRLRRDKGIHHGQGPTCRDKGQHTGIQHINIDSRNGTS